MRGGGFVNFAARNMIFFLVIALAVGVPAEAIVSSKGNPKRSSILFPLQGNVYPKGHYLAEVHVGQPSKPYCLDPDTGSDLTWLQCDAPCHHCTETCHPLYRPSKEVVRPNDDVVRSGDCYCTCDNAKQKCDYKVEYADESSSSGYLLKDYFSFPAGIRPKLVLGCGTNQKQDPQSHSFAMDGVLGLGKGKSSILSQLYDQEVIRNVVGHCLSGGKKGGGFFFLGDYGYDTKKIVWTQMSKDDKNHHYAAGPAKFTFGGNDVVGLKDLGVVFDSGLTYTYLSHKEYEVVLSLVKNQLKGKPLVETHDDDTLPVCWKDINGKPFRHVSEVEKYFKPLGLIFPKSKTLNIPPKGFLIISSKGNACFGILDGAVHHIPYNVMVGDISMLDIMVVYDNEKQQIGWSVANCDRPTKTTNYTIVM